MQGPVDQLRKLLDAESWPAALLVEGEDLHARGALIDAILARIPEDERGTAVDRFDGKSTVRALDAARTPSLLGGRRIVIVDEPAELGGSGSKEVQQALSSYLQSGAPSALLVLVAGKIDKRRVAVKEFAKKGWLVSCPKPRERDMPGVIEGLAKAAGLKLDGWATQAIADAVGVEPALAAREIEKLAMACGDGGAPPDRETVEALLRPGHAVGAFELEDALLAGRTRDGVELLDRLLTEGHAKEPLAVLGRLAGICRRLAVAHGAVESGGGESAVQQALGCHPFVAKKYARAARVVGGAASKALAQCVDADLALKSGGDARTALMRIVLALRGRPSGQGRRRHAS